jgi:hypothetical protein
MVSSMDRMFIKIRCFKVIAICENLFILVSLFLQTRVGVGWQDAVHHLEKENDLYVDLLHRRAIVTAPVS